jgi:predicted amidophosphoribosyltransferase
MEPVYWALLGWFAGVLMLDGFLKLLKAIDEYKKKVGDCPGCQASKTVNYNFCYKCGKQLRKEGRGGSPI